MLPGVCILVCCGLMICDMWFLIVRFFTSVLMILLVGLWCFGVGAGFLCCGCVFHSVRCFLGFVGVCSSEVLVCC